MRSTILFSVLLVVVLLSACNSNHNTELTAAQNKAAEAVIIDETGENPVSDRMDPSTIVEISAEDFQLMLDFIKEKGFKIPDPDKRGNDRQYTFYDSKNNRHAMIPAYNISEDKYQISVWAYRDSVKDQEHFFGYDICTRRGAHSYLPDHHLEPGEAENIKRGVEEFLVKVRLAKEEEKNRLQRKRRERSGNSRIA